ncbi:hypothetical protein hp2018_0898 [Helicobacter pylori 2018]|nr:hypothetical protein hp2018_0898 [Helicobacter pylori 2018]
MLSNIEIIPQERLKNLPVQALLLCLLCFKMRLGVFLTCCD